MSQRDDHAGAAPAAAPLAEVLREYQSAPGQYDELRDASGQLRPHWATFFDRISLTGADDFTREQRQIDEQLRDNGFTYTVHADGGPPRAWSLDVLPQIVPADEWEPLTRGLKQRAQLLELIARDLYGAQQLIVDGLIPASLVMQHPGFLRPIHGVTPAGGRFLHVVAFDVGRGPDGAWRVFDVRTQAPSGSGYALENRLTISQLYSDAFRDLNVCRLAPYFRALRESILEAAPCDSGTPHIALLTPGPFSETYVEHAYLARYLGFTLVEGADLTVRDDHVYLKTVAGLRPVHAILRRLDDDYADPLELRAESTIGVPGLVQAWRAGHVLLANALGVTVLESPALQPCLPMLCERLMREPLALPSVPTIWPSRPGGFDGSDASLERTVAKTVYPDKSMRTALGPRLSPDERRAWAARLQNVPDRFVLEEYVPLSHVPVWDSKRFESRALMMRVFLVADGHDGYTVMDGGLARIGGEERDLVSGQRGGGSKDIWVLSNRPIERVSLLRGRLRPSDIAGRERMVSSRAAEHLFWMGRYAERSENAARLARAVLSRLQYGDPLVSVNSRPIVRTCALQGLLGQAADPGARDWQPQEFEEAVIGGVFESEPFQSVAFNIEQTVRTAGTVRDRLSMDNWRELNRLSDMLRRSRRRALARTLDTLDRAIMSLVAVGGLEMAHMTRDAGWRFLTLGRHLERLAYVTTTVGEIAASDSLDDPPLLEWLLDLSDGLVTYRARYMGRAEWLAVADLLLFDPTNPRSAVFQLAKMSKHVMLLSDLDLAAIVPRLDALAGHRTGQPAEGELFPRADSLTTFLQSSNEIAREVSDAVTLRYFSHAYEASLTLL